jgi:hypothetical protein
VTSVTAWTGTVAAASAADRLRALIVWMAAVTARSGALACLIAVEMIPVPRGFVRTRASPGRAPTFRQTRPGWTRPTTA